MSWLATRSSLMAYPSSWGTQSLKSGLSSASSLCTGVVRTAASSNAQDRNCSDQHPERLICSLRRVGIHHLTHFALWLSSNSGRVVDLTSIGRWLCPLLVVSLNQCRRPDRIHRRFTRRPGQSGARMMLIGKCETQSEVPRVNGVDFTRELGQVLASSVAGVRDNLQKRRLLRPRCIRKEPVDTRGALTFNRSSIPAQKSDALTLVEEVDPTQNLHSSPSVLGCYAHEIPKWPSDQITSPIRAGRQGLLVERATRREIATSGSGLRRCR